MVGVLKDKQSIAIMEVTATEPLDDALNGLKGHRFKGDLVAGGFKSDNRAVVVKTKQSSADGK
jgi:hypothetical protein